MDFHSELIAQVVEKGGLSFAMLVLGGVTYMLLRAIPTIAGMYQGAVTSLQTSMSQMQTQIERCDDNTRLMRVRMDTLEEEDAKKAGRITELEKQVNQLKAENEKLRKELDTKDAEMDRALKAKDVEIAKLKERVAELEHPKDDKGAA